MTMDVCWMVRAGQGGAIFADFKEQSIVTIGWHAVSDLSSASTREEVAAFVKKAWPEWSNPKVANAAGRWLSKRSATVGTERGRRLGGHFPSGNNSVS